MQNGQVDPTGKELTEFALSQARAGASISLIPLALLALLCGGLEYVSGRFTGNLFR